MPRKSSPNAPRPGVSGKQRICAACKEPAEHALMHDKLKVWLCSPCTTRLNEKIKFNAAKEREAVQETNEMRHLAKSNRKVQW